MDSAISQTITTVGACPTHKSFAMAPSKLVRVTNDRGYIPTASFDGSIFDSLPGYLSALQGLDVPTPVILMITLQGIRGARLGVGQSRIDEVAIIDRAVLELPEIVVEQFGTNEDYQRAARPAFDALWNTGGFHRSRHFDASGRWIDPRR